MYIIMSNKISTHHNNPFSSLSLKNSRVIAHVQFDAAVYMDHTVSVSRYVHGTSTTHYVNT